MTLHDKDHYILHKKSTNMRKLVNILGSKNTDDARIPNTLCITLGHLVKNRLTTKLPRRELQLSIACIDINKYPVNYKAQKPSSIINHFFIEILNRWALWLVEMRNIFGCRN
ncbi:hypothetical protein Glove_420g56 [Diversispora epigaea]|uniref:Uncharacterized protein n=1 Tax=Diversispora epigaea TaxID=1348612 RepID=A0A397H1A9_9GLOM|nr:hypothetical protein Glove_420g56 [Diversispora epigaea]